MIDLIGIDADDTLWKNEHLYVDGRRHFDRILGRSPDSEDIDAIMERIEVANLPYYGYGVASFILSLVEAAAFMNGTTGNQVQEILQLGKEMIDAEIQLLDEVEETLAELAAEFPLILITKGDLLHQEAKVERSGLAGYFRHVQVVSDKTAATYASVLQQQGADPSRFLMVGNSIRSDILPVLEIGGRAIYIPQELIWSHETAAPPKNAGSRYFEVARLAQVPALVRRLRAGQEPPKPG